MPFGIVGLVSAWYFWPQIVAAAATAGVTLPTGSTPSGTAARDYIVAAFVAGGLSENTGRAAAVNAYAESRWNPSILSGYRDSNGVRENSVGWFQLNAKGLGAEVALPLVGQPPNETVADGDPRLSGKVQCDIMIAACKSSASIMMLQASGTVRQLTAAFTVYIEHPANATSEGASRVALVDVLFPGIA